MLPSVEAWKVCWGSENHAKPHPTTDADNWSKSFHFSKNTDIISQNVQTKPTKNKKENRALLKKLIQTRQDP